MRGEHQATVLVHDGHILSDRRLSNRGPEEFGGWVIHHLQPAWVDGCRGTRRRDFGTSRAILKQLAQLVRWDGAIVGYLL
jgi:hypothetical protein